MENNAKLMNIRDKVVKFANERNMIFDGDTVVVATSGGADSMALLMFMNKFKDSFADDVSVVACTVNHGIRGETSKRDMVYVQEKCKDLGIECITFDASTDGTVVPDNASEEWARQLRYSYFAKLPEILGIDESKLKIATAHTMSDEAETVLFRLSRSSSYKSLMGIPAKRDKFIRPFLCLERKDTEDLCEIFGIEYMTDETNLTDDYCRNKIRHNVLPVLKEINDKAVNHLAELAEFSERLNNYFLAQAYRVEDQSASGVNRYNVYEVLKNDPLVVEAFLNYIMEEYGVQPSKTNMAIAMDMLRQGSGAVELSKSVTFYIEEFGSKEEPKLDLVVAVKEDSVEDTEINDAIFDKLEQSGSIRFYTVNEGNTFKVHIIERSADTAYSMLRCFGLKQLSRMTSYEKLFKSGWEFTYASMNDEFKPACRSKRKIAKLYHEMGVVSKMMDSVPCIKDADGKVVWLYGVGFTDDVGIMDKDGNFTENLTKSSKPDVYYTICNY